MTNEELKLVGVARGRALIEQNSILAFDKLNRKVTVFAQNADVANAILDDWRGGQQLKEGK